MTSVVVTPLGQMTCIVVTALCNQSIHFSDGALFCNQPEAFESDLGDDQSCYLYECVMVFCMSRIVKTGIITDGLVMTHFGHHLVGFCM